MYMQMLLLTGKADKYPISNNTFFVVVEHIFSLILITSSSHDVYFHFFYQCFFL